jgi:hypothetical protein
LRRCDHDAVTGSMRAGIIVLDVADASAHRPADHFIGRVGASRALSCGTHTCRQAGPFCPHRIEDLALPPDLTRRNGMARRSLPRKVTYFEPVPPRFPRNTIIVVRIEMIGKRFDPRTGRVVGTIPKDSPMGPHRRNTWLKQSRRPWSVC